MAQTPSIAEKLVTFDNLNSFTLKSEYYCQNSRTRDKLGSCLPRRLKIVDVKINVYSYEEVCTVPVKSKKDTAKLEQVAISTTVTNTVQTAIERALGTCASIVQCIFYYYRDVYLFLSEGSSAAHISTPFHS